MRRALLRWLITGTVFLALAALFFIANRHAFSGYFSSDDLDTLAWASVIHADTILHGLLTPKLNPSNFRPVGALAYRGIFDAAGLNFRIWVAVIFALHALTCLCLWRLLRRLEFPRLPAASATVFYAFHPALFAAWWAPMYVFDVLCCLFAMLTLLAWTARRYWLAFLCFWLSFKSKEMAVFVPVALAALELQAAGDKDAWFRKSLRRWAKLAPFFLVSLLFGLQAIANNSGQGEAYQLKLGISAMQPVVSTYGPYLAVALLFLPLLRDRRVWVALALLGAVAPLLLLPGRVFTVYLYLPLTGAAVGLAAVFQRLPRTVYAPALAVWLLWSYATLRHYRRVELEEARIRSRYVAQVLANREVLRDRLQFLIDGKPAALETWGVAGSIRLAGGAHGLEASALQLTEGWRERVPDDAIVLSWDAPEQRLIVAPLRPRGDLLSHLDLADPASLPQVLDGFEAAQSCHRPMREIARFALATPPGARGLRFEWRVDHASGPSRVAILLDGEWLADLPAEPPGTYSWTMPARLHLGRCATVELRSAGDIRVAIRSAGFH